MLRGPPQPLLDLRFPTQPSPHASEHAGWNLCSGASRPKGPESATSNGPRLSAEHTCCLSMHLLNPPEPWLSKLAQARELLGTLAQQEQGSPPAGRSPNTRNSVMITLITLIHLPSTAQHCQPWD